MSEQWVKETMELLEDWEQRGDFIRDKIGELDAELASLEQSIIGGHELLAAYMAKHNVAPLTSRNIKTDNLASKSYPEMLITIAQERQGYLRVADAVDILLRLNVGKDKMSIQNNIYSALNRMSKQFTKIAPGQYRYTNHRQERAKVKPSGVRQAVKELKEKNPQMTKKEVVNHLLRTGFDFKGKRPMSAVNITWAYLGYSEEGKTNTLPGME